MSEALLLRIMPHGQSRAYPDRALIHQRGDQVKACSIVLSGEVHLTNVDLYGEKPLTSAIVTRGQLYGVYQVMSGASRSHTAYAVGQTSVLLLREREYRRLLDEDADFRDFMVGFHGYRLVQVMELLEEERRGMPLRRRVARRLLARLRRDGEELAITQGELAEELGASRYAVGTILGELRKQGLIELRYGHIALPRRSDLRAWMDAQPGFRRAST